MKKIEFTKIGRVVTILTFVVSVTLIVIGFILPPTGSIDGSVLTAVGELFAWGVLFEIPYFTRLNKNLRIQKGDTTIELNDDDTKQ